jgi:AAA ATPase domain
MEKGVGTAGGLRAAVVIPTTSGPVLIVSLREEAPEVGRSTVCINKTIHQAGIALDYNKFVKQPTGLVHRLFGKAPFPVYRLDVSNQIEAGSSWQLAVLVAHALRESGDRLDEDNGKGSDLIWATGEVSPLNYAVKGVGHVAEKLRNSRPLIEEALLARRRANIFVPADNQPNIDRDISEWLVQNGLELKAVTSIDEVFKCLALPVIPRAASKIVGGQVADQRLGDMRITIAAPASNIPIRVPTHFVGREHALEAIEKALKRYQGRVAITALHGLRGVGKTTLAAAFAERHRSDYRTTWWIRAQTEPTMRADLVALGVQLGWVGRDDMEEPALAAVMEGLRRDGEGVLLIFDNAVDADGVKPFLPRGGTAQILVTSTAYAWRGIAEPVELQVWPKNIGADYLIVRTGREGEREAAEALSEMLDGLPLAHEQAAAYCERLETAS